MSSLLFKGIFYDESIASDSGVTISPGVERFYVFMENLPGYDDILSICGFPLYQ